MIKIFKSFKAFHTFPSFTCITHSDIADLCTVTVGHFDLFNCCSIQLHWWKLFPPVSGFYSYITTLSFSVIYHFCSIPKWSSFQFVYCLTGNITNWHHSCTVQDREALQLVIKQSTASLLHIYWASVISVKCLNWLLNSSSPLRYESLICLSWFFINLSV